MSTLSPTKSHAAAPAFPACFVDFPPEAESKGAAYFLAAEEHIARTFPPDNYFFVWQTPPTVVYGRHQIIENEADLDFCRREGVEVVQRKSGGGCIYSDGNNLMLSLITRRTSVKRLFAEYSETVAALLTRLGAPAEATGRNDIMLCTGRKVCGNAFYQTRTRNIVHGTMLYDVDVRRMSGCLTPDARKLARHGVKSVPQRVGGLKDLLPLSIDELRAALIDGLTNRRIAFDAYGEP